jgi:hypothetical protein
MKIVSVKRSERKPPPRAVCAWLAATNLLMAGVVVFLALHVDHVLVYVFAAPLVLILLLTALAYGLLTRPRPTS